MNSIDLHCGKGQVFLYSVTRLLSIAAMNELKPMLADWIRDARKAACLSQEELGARLSLELGGERGYSKANISHWETQKHSPNLQQLMAIAKVTGHGLPQPLLGSMQTSASIEEQDASPFASPLELHVIPGAMRVRVVANADTVPIRFLPSKLHAGIEGYETEPEEDGGEMYQLPREVIEQLNLDPRHLFAALLKGRSMEPMLFEGDKVVVYTGDRRPISRELYAVNFDGEGCVKQLLHRGGQWYLHSLNPDFDPINMRSGRCEIVGRVVYQPGRIVTGRL